jgi:hypothetical protein
LPLICLGITYCKLLDEIAECLVPKRKNDLTVKGKEQHDDKQVCCRRAYCNNLDGGAEEGNKAITRGHHQEAGGRGPQCLSGGCRWVVLNCQGGWWGERGSGEEEVEEKRDGERRGEYGID